MDYKIKPLSDRLLVRPIEETQQSELIVPDEAKEKPQKGEVIEIGPGKDGKPIEEKVGNIVLYRKGAGMKVTGTPDLLMRSGVDTIAILEPEAKATV